MATTNTFLERARDAIVNEAYPWYQKFCSWLPPEAQKTIIPILLAANFLALRKLVESIGRSGGLYDIRPYQLTANASAKLIVDVDKQGRPREVAVWVDSAVGLPDPTIRVGVDGGATTGAGIRVKPGDVNELGQVPPDTRLYVASDVDITLYVIERG